MGAWLLELHRRHGSRELLLAGSKGTELGWKQPRRELAAEVEDVKLLSAGSRGRAVRPWREGAVLPVAGVGNPGKKMASAAARWRGRAGRCSVREEEGAGAVGTWASLLEWSSAMEASAGGQESIARWGKREQRRRAMGRKLLAMGAHNHGVEELPGGCCRREGGDRRECVRGREKEKREWRLGVGSGNFLQLAKGRPHIYRHVRARVLVGFLSGPNGLGWAGPKR
jgi:hypothetical protein